MNIQVIWDNEEKTILRYEFQKGWSWQELYRIFETGYTMLDTVQHRVAVIMDFSNASLFAPSGAISRGQTVVDNPRHPNVGLTVVVGSSLMSGMFRMINKLAGTISNNKWDITFVNKLQEAYEAIKTYDAKQDAERE